jgi:branched-chain amino acid transport system substrate-binding protein
MPTIRVAVTVFLSVAASLKDFHPAMLLKGLNTNTSPTDCQPMEEIALQRFNGQRFEVFGELLSARMN